MSVQVDGDRATKVTGLQVDTTDPQYGTAPSATGVTNLGVYSPYRVQKINVLFSALTAAATTQDITLWTVPAKTRVVRVVARVKANFTGGAISAMTLKAGVSAGGLELISPATSVFSGTPVLGGAFATLGTGLIDTTRADYFDTAQTVQCRFTSTGANVNAATAGEVDIYIETVSYP